MLAETLLPTAQQNSYPAYPSQREFNPFALPVYVRSAQSPLIYPVADGYQFSRPIVAPELQPQPQATPTVANNTSIDFVASGLYAVAQHENQSVFKLLSALIVTAYKQGLAIGDAPIIVKASQTELVAETIMPKVGVKRAIKVAEEKGYLTQTVQGSAFDGKSCYRLNLPFCLPVDTKHDHKGWTQNVPIPSQGYEQTKLDLTAETANSEKGGHKGWTQNVPIPPAALTGTNAQGQTYAQIRDSNRNSTLNINDSTINSRNNRNTESRVGESERIQAYAQEQGQMNAPVSTSVATHAQSQMQTTTPVATRARSSRSRTNAPDTRPLQLTLNLNLTGFTGQTQTIAAAPGVTVNITPTEQAQPITDHIGEVKEMVATVAVADTAIPRGPSVAVAPDTTAFQACEPTKVGDYSYNSPVIENTTQPAQPIAAIVSPIEPTANNATVTAASEFPKHVTSYQQLEDKSWTPHFLKVECSDALKQTITDFSQLFGDCDHLNSNITQVAKLFNSVQAVNSRYSTWEFIELMQECRELTYQFAVLRPGEKAPPPGQVRNRMAYFFKTLRDKTGQVVAEFEKAKAGNAEAKANPITVKLPQTGKAVVETNPAKMAANSPALNKFKKDIEPKMQVERPTVTTTSNDNYSAPATAPIAKLEEKEELAEPEVEFAGETKTANAVRQVTPTMTVVISSNDKAVGENFNDFGSYIVDGVLYAKFYRQGGPCDVSRWATWLKPYGISRVEII